MNTTKLIGSFVQIVYGPKGNVEGFLIRVDGQLVQVVIDKDSEKSSHLVSSLSVGQALVVATRGMPPSNKGLGEHPVHALQKVVSVDGATPRKVAAQKAGYTGRIVRLNYAKHGAPNGYVLDSGDFIHVKPDGFLKFKLKVGDQVTADGDAHFLSTGGGWAVEATSVNGKRLA